MWKVFQSGLIGFLISLSSSYLMVTLAILQSNATITGQQLLEQIMIAAILGIAIGISTRIYKMERLSFTVQILIHFLLVTLFVGIAGYIGRWFDLKNLSSCVSVFISEIFIYVTVWSFFYTKTKHDIKEMNDYLQKRQGM